MKNSQSLRTASATNNLSTLTDMHGAKLAVQNKMAKPTEYSDEKLLCLAEYYGTQTILWRRKFIGLLPEVNRRKLFEQKGFSSIIEFGKKMAGLSEDQIRLAINLEKRFEDKPLLHAALVKGEVSLNKLARVVSVANETNEKTLVEAAIKLSQSSLETFVKDEKNHQMSELLGGGEDFSGNCDHRYLFDGQSLSKAGNPCEDTFVRAHKQDYETNVTMGQVGLRNLQLLGLDERTVERLKELKNLGHDINGIVNEMLDKREEEIEERKEEIAGEVIVREEVRRENGKEPSRYVSVKTKRILQEEYGTKCAVAQCVKDAVHLHHAVPFSIGKSNSPDMLKPLCRAHHDIVHSMNDRYLERKSST